MSDSVNKSNLHILLGISNMGETLIKSLNDEFNKRGITIGICASKYSKLSIEQYVEEHKDIDVVIVSEYLQKSKPYTIADFERLNDLNDKMLIIPILLNDKKGTNFISELLSIGIYTALFQEDATIPVLVDLICSGRTRKEARYYYGTETINDVSDTVNIQTCVDHIAFGGDRELTKDRADYVKGRLSQKEFEIVISRLPKDVQDRLRVYEDYASYFEEKTNATLEKKSIFPNKLIKSIISENKAPEENDEVPMLIMQEVQSAIKKVVIGFAGTHSRVGVTHQTMLFANYLNAAGYKVAVVENSMNDSRSFHTLIESYNVKECGDYFTFKDVDYYPNYNLSELNRIFLKDYNFVLIDFGIFNENISMEFGRCVLQIIVSGSKPWETPMLERLMLLINDEDILKEFNYLFMFTPDNDRKTIIKNMDVLDKVYFGDYLADPFSKEGYDAIKEILIDYLPENYINKRGKGVFGKIQKLFE